jgi:hypothetical protein
MSTLSTRAYRLYLRLFRGRAEWHRRYYRPTVHLVEAGDKLWFEEKGRVVEARPLASLRGQCSGRCNLVLSGPSVREISDPLRICDNDWVGVNGSPALFGHDIRNMTYYHFNDATYLRSSLESFLEFANQAQFTVIDFRVMYELLRLAPGNMPRTELVVYDSWAYPLQLPLGKIESITLPPSRGGIYISTDPRLGLPTGGTVAYTAGQFLWHAGYGSLYIYGLDLTDTGRFYSEKNEQPQMLDKSFQRVIMPAFELLALETSKTDFRIFNCNPASSLPASVFPYMEAEASLA